MIGYDPSSAALRPVSLASQAPAGCEVAVISERFEAVMETEAVQGVEAADGSEAAVASEALVAEAVATSPALRVRVPGFSASALPSETSLAGDFGRH